jgi:hypothetical protein
LALEPVLAGLKTQGARLPPPAQGGE